MVDLLYVSAAVLVWSFAFRRQVDWMIRKEKETRGLAHSRAVLPFACALMAFTLDGTGVFGATLLLSHLGRLSAETLAAATLIAASCYWLSFRLWEAGYSLTHTHYEAGYTLGSRQAGQLSLVLMASAIIPFFLTGAAVSRLPAFVQVTAFLLYAATFVFAIKRARERPEYAEWKQWIQNP